MSRAFRKGDLVVYTRQKHSTRPGPRARNVRPAAQGETYDYLVDKFRIVGDSDGAALDLITQKGKHYSVAATDPRLRHPTLLERLWLLTRGRSRVRALRRQVAAFEGTPAS